MNIRPRQIHESNILKDKGLSFCEQLVVTSILEGNVSKEQISEDLGIKVNTISTHLKNIFRKLEIRNIKDILYLRIRELEN